MANYILCPRCDLNYILDTEDYCAVCKADLKIGPKLMFSAQDDDDISEKILCPSCRTRYIDIEEELCEYCRNDALRQNDHEADVSFDSDDDSWRQFLDDDEKADISNKGDEEESLLLSQIEEEEALDDEDEAPRKRSKK